MLGEKAAAKLEPLLNKPILLLMLLNQPKLLRCFSFCAESTFFNSIPFTKSI
jgi:hypothetical protein